MAADTDQSQRLRRENCPVHPRTVHRLFSRAHSTWSTVAHSEQLQMGSCSRTMARQKGQVSWRVWSFLRNLIQS